MPKFDDVHTNKLQDINAEIDALRISLHTAHRRMVAINADSERLHHELEQRLLAYRQLKRTAQPLADHLLAHPPVDHDGNRIDGPLQNRGKNQMLEVPRIMLDDLLDSLSWLQRVEG